MGNFWQCTMWRKPISRATITGRSSAGPPSLHFQYWQAIDLVTGMVRRGGVVEYFWGKLRRLRCFDSTVHAAKFVGVFGAHEAQIAGETPAVPGPRDAMAQARGFAVRAGLAEMTGSCS